MNNPTLDTAKRFMSKGEEYMSSVFEVAEALQRIKDSGHIKAMKILTDEENYQFLDDVKMVLEVINIDSDKLSEPIEDESCGCTGTNVCSDCIDEDADESISNEELDTFMTNVSEALLELTRAMQRMANETVSLKNQINSHEAALKMLLEGE